MLDTIEPHTTSLMYALGDKLNLAYGDQTNIKITTKCILRLNCHIFTVKLPQYNGKTATLKTVLPR